MERIRELLYVERHRAGSDRGLSCALEVAQAFDARLVVAGVVDRPGGGLDGAPLLSGEAQRRETRLRLWRRRLETLTARARAAGVDARMRLLEGHPARSVLAEADRQEADLVMAVADTGGVLWPWRAHATDLTLLRRCSCPVWLLEPAQGPGIRVVMAAVDVAEGCSPELNRRIVAMAAALARTAGAVLHVVHAWELVGEPILASPVHGLSRSRLRGLLAATRRDRRGAIESLLAREAPGLDVRVSLPKAEPVWAIRREAASWEADVVVVGSARRDGVGALLFGNVGERLVGRVPGAVLSVGTALKAPAAAWNAGGRAEQGRPLPDLWEAGA